MSFIRNICNSQKKFLIFIFLFAFLIRLAIIIFLGDAENPEMWEHGMIARNMHEGHGYSMHWPYPSFSEERQLQQQRPPEFGSAFIPPLNPFIIYLSFEIFGDNSSAYIFLMFLNAVLSSITAIVVYKITEKIHSKKVARYSALLFALFLPAAYGVITFSGSSLYHLLALLVIYFAIRCFSENNVKPYIYLGIFSGLLALTRSEFLALAFIIFAALAFKTFIKKEIRIAFSRAAFLSLVSALIFLVFVTPWTVRNSLQFGKVVPIVSHPWHEFWRGNNKFATGGENTILGTKIWTHPEFAPHIIKKLDSLEYDKNFEVKADMIFKEEVVDFYKENPGKAMILAGKRLLFFWTVDPTSKITFNPLYIFFVIITIIPAAVGFTGMYKRRKHSGALIIFGAFVVFYTALVTAVNYESRYQVYFLTIIIPIAGAGWAMLLEKIKYSFSKS